MEESLQGSVHYMKTCMHFDKSFNFNIFKDKSIPNWLV